MVCSETRHGLVGCSGETHGLTAASAFGLGSGGMVPGGELVSLAPDDTSPLTKSI